MNPRITKDIRVLLPAFALTLSACVPPFFIRTSEPYLLMTGLFSLGCMIMGALAFGNEFQQGTLSLLLSQPIPRVSLWKEKMFCLGSATVIVTTAAWLAFNLREKFQVATPWILIFIPLCAFCGAPLWTLLSRSTLIGVILAFLAPLFILGGNSWLHEELIRSRDDQKLQWYSGVTLFVVYCGLAFWFGYSRFRTLQVLDAGSVVLGRELGIPARLEVLLLRPFAAGFNRPFATLLKKELRLQQASFFLAALFCLVAVLGGILYLGQLHLAADKRWAQWIFTFDYAIYTVMLPLMAGALCVAEEKALGVADWHLTLPPSILKQWTTKILVALCTSVGLGLLLPGILALVGEQMFSLSHSASDFSLDPEAILVFCTFVVGHLLLTSIVIYAACLSTNTIRAIVLALGMLLLGFFALHMTTAMANRYDHFGLRAQFHLADPLLVAIPLFILLCLVQWFSFISYRARKLTTLQLALQGVILIGSLCLLTFVFTLKVAL